MATYVYLIHEEGLLEPVKIGIAANVNKRLSNLKSGNPRQLVLYKRWMFKERDEALDVEECTLRAFRCKHCHLHGEWIWASAAEVAEYVEAFLDRIRETLSYQVPSKEGKA